MTLAEQVSGALRALRMDAGLSQSQMGKLLGMPRNHVSRVERDKQCPSTEMIQRWLEALDKSWYVFAKELDYWQQQSVRKKKHG